MRVLVGILIALLFVALVVAGPVAGWAIERRRKRVGLALSVAVATAPVNSNGHWAAGGKTMEVPLVVIEEGYVEEDLSEAERQFLADPLGSWVLPPLDAIDYLPTADETFRQMVAMNWLTGVGHDIDAEWEAWNLYETEEVNA